MPPLPPPARARGSAATLALLAGHLKPGGRIAVFDYAKSPVSHKWVLGV